MYKALNPLAGLSGRVVQGALKYLDKRELLLPEVTLALAPIETCHVSRRILAHLSLIHFPR